MDLRPKFSTGNEGVQVVYVCPNKAITLRTVLAVLDMSHASTEFGLVPELPQLMVK